MGPFLHGPQDPLDGNSRFYRDACSGFAVQNSHSHVELSDVFVNLCR